MGHAENDVFNAASRSAIDQPIEQRNDGFTTFKRESFLAEILGVQKAFELFRRDQFPKQTLLHFDWERLWLDQLTSDFVRESSLLFLALNVAIFNATLPQ